MKRLDEIVVTQITRAICIHSPKGRNTDIQNRHAYGLSFALDGQITYTHNGKDFVSNPDVAILLPMSQSYHLHGNKTGNFPLIDFFAESPISDTFITIPITNPSSFIHDFELIRNSFLFGNPNAKTFSIFYSILHRLANQGGSNNTLLPAIKYLESNFSNPLITNELLAGLCNISEVYFRRLFLKEYNMTPRQFIIELRINKAKQLLAEGNMKINSVAEACGFLSQYHFSRLFKEKTGINPSEYVRENLIKRI